MPGRRCDRSLRRAATATWRCSVPVNPRVPDRHPVRRRRPRRSPTGSAVTISHVQDPGTPLIGGGTELLARTHRRAGACRTRCRSARTSIPVRTTPSCSMKYVNLDLVAFDDNTVGHGDEPRRGTGGSFTLNKGQHYSSCAEHRSGSASLDDGAGTTRHRHDRRTTARVHDRHEHHDRRGHAGRLQRHLRDHRDRRHHVHLHRGPTRLATPATGTIMAVGRRSGRARRARSTTTRRPALALTINAGTKVSTTGPLNGLIFTGGPNEYATRHYALLPDLLHSTDYVITAPGDDPRDQGVSAPLNLYIFNPDPSTAITVNVVDSGGADGDQRPRRTRWSTTATRGRAATCPSTRPCV